MKKKHETYSKNPAAISARAMRTSSKLTNCYELAVIELIQPFVLSSENWKKLKQLIGGFVDEIIPLYF